MADFHRILKVKQSGTTLIVIPEGNGLGFRYNDLHKETSAVRRMLAQSGVADIVIDLGKLNYFGSEFIGALIQLARTTTNSGGRAAICNASDRMRQVLVNMNLHTLWPYFDTRAEALQSLADEPDSP